MSDSKNNIGLIAWVDQTSEDAEKVRDFYEAVVGWQPSPVKMGDYSDFNMMRPDDDHPVAGVCHSRGHNADLPTGWLIYIIVENLDSSMEACTRMGGKVVAGPKDLGEHGRYCVVEDPGGALAALYQAGQG
jgi:predicted enzyme related to lactoylglutathione lyase